MKPEPNRPLKVAFIVGAFPKLSETFILDQVTGLIDRGCEVDIYAECPEEREKLHPDAVSYNVMGRTVFADRNMPRHLFLRALKGGLAMVRSTPRQAGRLLRSLNVFRYGKDAMELLWFYRVLSIDPQKSYDVVHCHFGPNGLDAVELQGMGLLEGRLVVSFHGYDLSQWLRRYGEDCYEELFRQGALFLPISHFWRKKLIDLGCPSEKIQVHRMGIDCDAFAYSPRRVEDGEEVRLISVCRLTEKKGIEYAIAAVTEAAKSSPLSYTIVGDGPLRSKLEQQIRESGASGIIRIVGWRLRDEIIEMLGEAHALLAPSVIAADGDMEGIPVTIMEAMARGLPVVSTYHSGIPELVIDRENGFLAPERDVGKLAECLRELVKHADRWAEIGARGREHVERHFNISRLNDDLVGIFGGLVQPGRTEAVPSDG
jgi:colanic acid/amylovoran biosynthesis glycosyltransferase